MWSATQFSDKIQQGPLQPHSEVISNRNVDVGTTCNLKKMSEILTHGQSSKTVLRLCNLLKSSLPKSIIPHTRSTLLRTAKIFLPKKNHTQPKSHKARANDHPFTNPSISTNQTLSHHLSFEGSSRKCLTHEKKMRKGGPNWRVSYVFQINHL